MLVCHCRVVSDRDVRAAIEDGAADVDAVMDACGVGDDCGGCLPSIEDLLDDAALALRDPAALSRQQRARRVPQAA